MVRITKTPTNTIRRLAESAILLALLPVLGLVHAATSTQLSAPVVSRGAGQMKVALANVARPRYGTRSAVRMMSATDTGSTAQTDIERARHWSRAPIALMVDSPHRTKGLRSRARKYALGAGQSSAVKFRRNTSSVGKATHRYRRRLKNVLASASLRYRIPKCAIFSYMFRMPSFS